MSLLRLFDLQQSVVTSFKGWFTNKTDSVDGRYAKIVLPVGRANALKKPIKLKDSYPSEISRNTYKVRLVVLHWNNHLMYDLISQGFHIDILENPKNSSHIASAPKIKSVFDNSSHNKCWCKKVTHLAFAWQSFFQQLMRRQMLGWLPFGQK